MMTMSKTMTTKMKLKQDVSNVLVRLGLKANVDYDFLAIKLLQNEVKLSEKVVDQCIQHYLTYLHPKIDSNASGYAKLIGYKHDDQNAIDYVNGVFSTLKKVVKSFDAKLASSIFKDYHFEEKYHLGKGLKVTSKTMKWLDSSCSITKTTSKKLASLPTGK